MSTYKKKIIIAIVVLIGMLLASSFAYKVYGSIYDDYGMNPHETYTEVEKGIGQTYNINADNLFFATNMLCAERHQLTWPSTAVKIIDGEEVITGYYPKSVYEVKEIVNITGNVSTSERLKQNGAAYNTYTKVDDANAILNTILQHEKATGFEPWDYRSAPYTKSPVQNGVWYYLTTWVNRVGKSYRLQAFSTSSDSYHPDLAKQLVEEGKAYAKSIKNEDDTIKNNTSTSKIGVNFYESGNNTYVRVGPFNFSFNGTIKDVIVRGDNNRQITNVTYGKYSGSTYQTISKSEIKSGTNFYIDVRLEDWLTTIQQITIKTTKNVRHVKITFLESRGGVNVQHLILYNPSTATEENEARFDIKIPLLGKISIKKSDASTGNRLANVGFTLQAKSGAKSGKYVSISNGKAVYTSTPVTISTNSNGEINITNLIPGTYELIETVNPHYGYEKLPKVISSSINVIPAQTVTLDVKNRREYIKISGIVWEDIAWVVGKQQIVNEIYQGENDDVNDKLLQNVTVNLKNRSGTTIATKTTNASGSYQFVDVRIDEMQNYYIEFIYNGMSYQSVSLKDLKASNTSKATEGSARDTFNANYAEIENNQSNTSDGNKRYDLNYDKGEYISTLNYGSNSVYGYQGQNYPINNTDQQYLITSNTYNAYNGYLDKIKTADEIRQEGITEIQNINLGVKEREQPNIAIVKDIKNVRLSINGYEHVYEYSQRFVNQGEYGDGFNVGVKFGNKYGSMSYTRPIYKADYEYINEEDKSKELQVYLTYQIGIKNLSNILNVRVNDIIDYYDSRYTLTSVGTNVDQRGEISGNLNYTTNTYNDQYSRIDIQTSTMISPTTQTDVYVQFRLSREAVVDILNDREMLVNVTEISSYSVFDANGIVYAGIDSNSNPGNSIPGERETTYEDDTDAAPALLLEVADARRMTGQVFVDSTTGEMLSNQVRQGSGAYEEGEEGVGGVEITLTENVEGGKVYKTQTVTEAGTYGITEVEDNNQENQINLQVENYQESNADNYDYVVELAKGEYLLGGFIPGDYTLSYTWGDETYTVQKYKGTVVDKATWEDKQQEANKELWYKDTFKKEHPGVEWDTTNDREIRTSDAIDNYNTRLEIDEELKEVQYNTTTTYEKMTSTTPLMGISVEYDTTYTASSGDRYEYEISSIDFGIVERARQELTALKNVRKLKVSLADGRVIADATIDKDGNLSGEITHVAFVPAPEGGDISDGFVRVEIDQELLQGAIVEVQYEIEIINTSELDYLSEDFYQFGITTGNLVEISPTRVIDYVYEGWTFNAEDNPDWEVRTIEEIKNLVVEEVYGTGSGINDTIILYTESLADQYLEPTETASVFANFNKILSTSDEIDFENEMEIIQLRKTGGGTTTHTPGNYIPGTGKTEVDDNTAENVIVIPSTGDNRNYILTFGIGIFALAILSTGIILIKKKVIK